MDATASTGRIISPFDGAAHCPPSTPWTARWTSRWKPMVTPRLAGFSRSSGEAVQDRRGPGRVLVQPHLEVEPSREQPKMGRVGAGQCPRLRRRLLVEPKMGRRLLMAPKTGVYSRHTRHGPKMGRVAGEGDGDHISGLGQSSPHGGPEDAARKRGDGRQLSPIAPPSKEDPGQSILTRPRPWT